MSARGSGARAERTLCFQILIQIVDASSVITWDFDVCKGDIVFNIYHSKRSPQPPKKDSLGAHSITSPGGNNVQLIDRVWQLGRDYSMVESPLICREGESVQVGRPRPSTARGFCLLKVGSAAALLSCVAGAVRLRERPWLWAVLVVVTMTREAQEAPKTGSSDLSKGSGMNL